MNIMNIISTNPNPNPNPNITFSSCLYQVKNRHGIQKHFDWFRTFIRIVNRFYLVIYTSINEYPVLREEIRTLDETAQQKIRVIVKPMTEFYNYKFERFWTTNNNRYESQLKDIADWRVHMLWCEKSHFVRETIENQYFKTEYYGWCDIGYFRDTLLNDEYRDMIHKSWPNPTTIRRLHKNKIYYGCNIQPKHMTTTTNWMIQHFHPSNINPTTGVPREVYHPNAHYFSGGFYITGREKAIWWCYTFQRALETYINANAFIKDDQHIISYCIFTGSTDRDFRIVYSNNNNSIDQPWFIFRDFLL